MKGITVRQWIIVGLLLSTLIALIDGAGLVRSGMFFRFDFENDLRVEYENSVDVNVHEIRGQLDPVTDLPQLVVVEGFQGELTLTRSTDGVINASYVARIVIPAEDASDQPDEVGVRWNRDGERLVLSVDDALSPAMTGTGAVVSIVVSDQMPRTAIGGLTLDMTIAVPDGVAVDIDSRGVTKVRGISADVAIKHSGVLSLTDVAGEARLTSLSGTTEIENIRGPLMLDISSGVFEANRVIGDVSGKLQQGIGELANIQGNVTLDLAGFRLEVDGVGGDVVLHGDPGTRNFVDVENVMGSVMTSGSVALSSR